MLLAYKFSYNTITTYSATVYILYLAIMMQHTMISLPIDQGLRCYVVTTCLTFRTGSPDLTFVPPGPSLHLKSTVCKCVNFQGAGYSMSLFNKSVRAWWRSTALVKVQGTGRHSISTCGSALSPGPQNG